MLIIDAHLDLAWNALQWNRDLLRSVYTIRTRENTQVGPGRAAGTVALPEMRQGRVALCFATVLARSTGSAIPHIDFGSPAQAHAVARGQLAYYRALESQGHIRVIDSLPVLNQHMEEWQNWDQNRSDLDTSTSPPLGFVISMEGADPILDPGELESWWDLGLRLIGPTHYGPGRYAGGTGTEVGLTTIGPPLLAEMERLGMILDVTHLSDEAFWQALDIYCGPLLASHNNCRALVPHQRQFSDAQLRALFERDAVIGAAFDAWMLQPGWITGVSNNAQVTLGNVVDHIDHICQLAGSARYAALGTDLDGGFGREQSPHDLDTIADLQTVAMLLQARGYDEADVALIMHGNWLRLLRQAWQTEGHA
jgi:membrane dipeptidase